MKISSNLIAMHQIIGCIKIEDQFFRNFGLRFYEMVNHGFVNIACNLLWCLTFKATKCKTTCKSFGWIDAYLECDISLRSVLCLITQCIVSLRYSCPKASPKTRCCNVFRMPMSNFCCFAIIRNYFCYFLQQLDSLFNLPQKQNSATTGYWPARKRCFDFEVF